MGLVQGMHGNEWGESITRNGFMSPDAGPRLVAAWMWFRAFTILERLDKIVHTAGSVTPPLPS